jgi:DNA-binding transcriptional LysR family regulator
MSQKPDLRLDLRWDDVRVFLALFRERNLGAAGKRLGLDASTASRRLAALEDALATRLFDRTPEGLRPTQAGERLVAAAEETEAGMLRFATAVDGLERKVEGVVRLATFPGLADNFLPPIFARLLERHPGLRLEVDVGSAVADLARREADLALRSVRPQSGDLVMTKLLSSRWLLMAAPERAKRIGKLAAWSDVPWVDWGVDLAHIPSARWLSTHAPEVRPVLRTSAGGAFVAAIEHDVGVGLMTEHFTQVRRIVPVQLAPALEPAAALWPSDDLWLVGHRALRDVPRVAAVWQFLVEQLSQATLAQSAQAKLPAAPAAPAARGRAAQRISR